MRTRVVDGREVMNYWDVEQPRFEIEQGPKWLSIDSKTGQLSGKPVEAGRADVVIAVKLERMQRSLDPGKLQWGVEQILDLSVEAVGPAKQAFTIETGP
jgi:hypothetical protein